MIKRKSWYVYDAYVQTKFRPCISEDDAREVTYAKILYRRNLLPLYIGFYKEFRPDKVRKSGEAALLGGHQLTAAISLSCGSRDEYKIGKAIRSRQWPFTPTDKFLVHIQSENAKLTFNICF
jgi:hypothetical protein